MSSKLLLFTRSFILKNLVLVLFFLSLKTAAQTAVSRIYTDWNGYWTSNSITLAGNRPDRENNLLAFTWNGKTYSTGVDNTILNTRSVTYNPQKFRALKIQTLGIDPANMYFLQGSMIDESATAAFLRPALIGSTATGAELAARLTDGINGLSLGTGVANIKAGTAEFKIGTNNLNLTGIDDEIPDLIVTQVAEPTGTADTFKFINASGATVGNELSIKFNTIPAIGTYSLDLFQMNGSVGFSPAATRDIRLLAIKTSEFGITAANASQVDRFVITFSGTSDCAFIAFNTNSLKLAELSVVNTPSMSSCGKVNDKINYTFDIKNTGEVPITDIRLTNLMSGLTITGNYIASLAPGATTQLTGVYTITANDVTAGRVVNSVKVTGTDPSLNTVEDTSISSSIDLLTPPKVETIIHVSCSELGKVILNNLPASGNWTIEVSPGSITKTGSGTSTTITGLAVGNNYTFRVINAEGCKSPASTIAAITNKSSTTWNGTTWSNDLPDATKNVVFTGAFAITADLNACSCTINNGVNLVVPSGRILKIINGLTVNSGGSLTFENSSSLIQVANTTNTGNITYKRNTAPVRRYDFTYWSSPVTQTSGFTLKNLSPDTLADKYYSYTPGTGWLIDYNGTLVMKPGQGYIVRAPQWFDINTTAVYPASFTGVPTNGDVPVKPAAGKWNLIGNPYPSAIDGRMLINNNGNVGSIYLWTHNSPPNGAVLGDKKYNYTTNDYAVMNGTGGIKTAGSAPFPTGYIAAGQAFFINAANGNDIIFTNSMRFGNNSDFYKIAEKTDVEQNRLWLNLTNAEGAFKQILVGYLEGATNSWDLNYDAATMNGNTFVDFYSINDGDKLTIQGRAVPFENTDFIPLGYKTSIAGDFTIAVDQGDGLFNNQDVYLEDKTTGTIQDLKAGNYTFTTAVGTFIDRFTLRYTNKTLGTGDFENIADGLLISVKDKVIKVTSAKEQIKEISIFDVTGKLLYNKKKVSTTEFSISNLQAADQVLLVKVTLENNFTTARKIIFN